MGLIDILKGVLDEKNDSGNLIRSNLKWLIIYLLFQTLLFFIVANVIGFSHKSVEEQFKNLIGVESLYISLAYIAAIILSGTLSSDAKAIMIFCRRKNPLPGCRAFTEIALNDARVNIDKLKQLFPSGFPSEPKEQNREWFQLYRKVADRKIVIDSHKSFLLMRDLAAISLNLLPLSLIGDYLWGISLNRIVYHAMFQLAILIFVIIAARNYGSRFVANVLVESTL